MKSARRGTVLALAAIAVLCTAWYNPVQAPDDANLRKKALALNNVTGDDPIKGKIDELVADKADTKQLLRVAAKMAKETPQPLNYNGAFILARAALELKELDASFALYRVCFELASKVQSAGKILDAFRGLEVTIGFYYQEKKYDQGLKASKEFLEIQEKLGANDVLKAETNRIRLEGMILAGHSNEARKEVDTLVKVRKTWRNVKLKAWVEQQTKNYSAAIKAYEEVLSLIAKDDALSNEGKTEFDAEIRLAIAGTFFAERKYDKCAKVAGELFESLEKLGAAAQGKSRVLKLQIRALALDGKLKEADKLFQQLGTLKKDEEANPLENLELKGWLEQHKGNDAEAAKIYQDLLTRIQKEDRLDKEVKEEYANEIRYLLSSVYIEMDQVDKAVKELEFLLNKEPANATYNNDLGYIWADHDMKLAEAEKLIRKAIDLDRQERKKKSGLSPDEDKDNAAYLDSLGWVLFKLKNYPEAKKWLLEAVKDKEGQHIEIMDHLGDVYMALGEKAEAVNTWKKALGLETRSKREKERKVQVEKKLKANQ